ncbi:glycosyltransferase family 4 protein [Pseudoxanthomonas sp. SGT-18]|uniref:glycosyltransferase n=1 Tax=Pseudoxanthomonas sp. SGT-18 TaxID=2493087 RepID=UPI000F62BEAD
MSNILIIAMGYPPVAGGVETYSEEVARAYLRKGLIPIVITKTFGERGWREVTYSEGRIRLYNTGRVSQPVAFARMLWQCANLLCRRSFEFIHATTWRPALAALMFSRRTSLILTVHGREVLNYPFFLKRPMIEVLRRANVVVTVSSATMGIARAALHGANPNGKWVVAFNGITHPTEARAHERRLDNGRTTVRLLSLSRLVPRKNVQGCITALAELRAEGLSNFEYWIGGRGPMLEDLRQAVADAGLEEQVRFLGYVEDADVPELYKWCDVFLHPQTHVGQGNDFEGFGLVIADAMSFGCAVLAGEAGGPKEFVKDGVRGLVVDGLDSVALKAALRELLTDPQLRQRLGASARDFALRNLSWDEHVDRILDGIPIQAGTAKPRGSEDVR